jgi:aminoglycoside phosphotransferase (APT) family kinase protein
MRNSNATIIRAIANALARDILPATEAPGATQQGKFVLALLGLLLSREPVGFIEQAQEEDASLLEAMRALIDARGLAVSPALDNGIGTARYHPAHAALLRQEAELAAATATLIAAQNAAPDAQIADTLDQLARSRLRLAELQLSHGNPVSDGPENQAPAIPNAAELQAYLRARLPGYASASITGMAPAPFSLGKQITFIDLAHGDGRADHLVMRQEKPVKIWDAGDSTAIRDEFRVIEVAASLGLPVPDPLLLDASGKLGPTFMLMPKVRGAQLGEVFQAFAPLSEEIIMQIAVLMAKLHGAGLEPFADYLRETGRGAVLDMNVREAMHARICEWERSCTNTTQYPNPTKLWLYNWLKRNIPDSADRPVYVHGDFGIHNLLAQDGQITACLDWEWSHVGNPVEDIAYLRPHIDAYSNWDRFVQHYSAHGGPTLRLSDEIVTFNACLSNVIFSGLAGQMAWFVEKGERRDMASVFGGDWYGYEFERMALKAALQQ